MSTLKRSALALVSMLLAVLTLGLLMAITAAVRSGYEQAISVFSVSGILPVVLLFALPGVILATPFVVLIKDAAGSRLWWILTLGIAIGPSFMLTWAIVVSHGHVNWQGDGMAVLLSGVIGSLTTVFYVSLLRILHRHNLTIASLSLNKK